MTVIVKEIGFPEQLLAVGVTVIVATTGVAPVFTVGNAEMFPVPLAPKPIEVVELAQLYWVPETMGLLEKLTAFVCVPAHFT